MNGLLKQSSYYSRGFILVELLVSVALLGVLAAINIPNISKFAGSGTVEAANTEAHNIQIAVLSYIIDNHMTGAAAGAIGPDNDLAAGSSDTSPKSFLVNPSGLQATYAINSDGEIVGANATSGGKWDSLTYTVGTGWHE